MSRLTKKDRQQAVIDLQKKVEAAIEDVPQGLTDEEVCFGVMAAIVAQNVIR